MINDKKMKLVKSENGINYYVFKPSLFSLYYNDKDFKHKVEPRHRFSWSHKMHMLWYVLAVRGGYTILYLEKNGEIISYIIFVKANSWIIRNCEKNDYYTIFLWTYPEHRSNGLGTLMAKTMLHDLQLKYCHFYKTIDKDNFPSMKVAENSGFCRQGECVKTGLLHTIHRADNGPQYLYSYSEK